MIRYVTDSKDWCHAGGKDHMPRLLPESDPDYIWSGPNYTHPHVLRADASNCSMCGVDLVRPAVLPDGIIA